MFGFAHEQLLLDYAHLETPIQISGLYFRIIRVDKLFITAITCHKCAWNYNERIFWGFLLVNGGVFLNLIMIGYLTQTKLPNIDARLRVCHCLIPEQEPFLNDLNKCVLKKILALDNNRKLIQNLFIFLRIVLFGWIRNYFFFVLLGSFTVCQLHINFLLLTLNFVAMFLPVFRYTICFFTYCWCGLNQFTFFSIHFSSVFLHYILYVYNLNY